MYFCPITKSKLIKAHIGPGKIWYSEDSGGRLLTLPMANYFLGQEEVSKVFGQASSRLESLNGKSCPSCLKTMRLVTGDTDEDAYHVEVCPKCELVWLDKGHHPDTSHLPKNFDQSFIAPKPFLQKALGFLGLPVEVHKRDDPLGILGIIIAVVIVLIHFLYTTVDPNVIKEWGFYPNDPLKNNGLNILSSAFLHGGPSHLIGNIYLFLIFADDVEQDLGPIKFLVFVLFNIIFSMLVTIVFSGTPTLPHIGFSGMISGLLSYYCLQFKDTRIAFMYPFIHLLRFIIGKKRAKATTFLIWGWVRIPVLVVFIFWVLKDIGMYLLFEQNHLTSVAHSVHIGGYVCGLVLWLFWGGPRRRIM